MDIRGRQHEVSSGFIRLAQVVVNAIWLDLGALNQGYSRREMEIRWKSTMEEGSYVYGNMQVCGSSL